MDIEAQVKQHFDRLTKPKDSLGRLEALVGQIAAVQQTAAPVCNNKAVVIMCADNGVTAENISPSPQKITYDVTNNFTKGLTAINILAKQAGARLKVVDIGVNADFDNPAVLHKKVRYGTADMAKGPAMTRQEAEQAIAAGIDVMQSCKVEGVQLVAAGEMGVGNTTSSAAVAAAYFGEPWRFVGRGAGLRPEKISHKARVIQRALAVNRPDVCDPLDVLAKVGGLDIAGLCGCFLGGAQLGIPVVIDGFVSAAAAFLACQINPAAKAAMICSHQSREPGAAAFLEALGLSPYLQLDMCLGEGTGAALMFSLIDSALAIYNEMATFEEAAIDGDIYQF